VIGIPHAVNLSFSILLYAHGLPVEQNQMPTPSRNRSRRPQFQPRIGWEFDLDEVHVIDARTRDFLSRAIAFCAGGAVAITGAYGLATGSYLAVEVVWAVAGPMFGALVTHYFGPSGRTTA
jgi:hypothetical protein